MKVRSWVLEQDLQDLIIMADIHFGVDHELFKKKLMQAEEVLIAYEDGNQIAGFLSYRLIREKKMLIDMVVLDSKYQGVRIAASLVPLIIDYAKQKGMKSIGGLVYKHNKKALNIFRHWGFRIKRYFFQTVLIEKNI